MKSKLWGIQCSFSAIFFHINYIILVLFVLPPPFSNLFFELMTKFFKLVNVIATFSHHLFKVFVEKSRQFFFLKEHHVFFITQNKNLMMVGEILTNTFRQSVHVLRKQQAPLENKALLSQINDYH